MTTKFEKYVDEVEAMISEFTANIPAAELHEIEDSIEHSEAGSGKIWFLSESVFSIHYRKL